MSRTCSLGSARCRRQQRSNAGMRSCTTPTDTSSDHGPRCRSARRSRCVWPKVDWPQPPAPSTKPDRPGPTLITMAQPTGGPSYEAARDELLEVVRQLEAGGLPLEQSLTLWERGEELAAICQAWLDGARERLEATRPGDGAAETDATKQSRADAG